VTEGERAGGAKDGITGPGLPAERPATIVSPVQEARGGRCERAASAVGTELAKGFLFCIGPPDRPARRDSHGGAVSVLLLVVRHRHHVDPVVASLAEMGYSAFADVFQRSRSQNEGIARMARPEHGCSAAYFGLGRFLGLVCRGAGRWWADDNPRGMQPALRCGRCAWRLVRRFAPSPISLPHHVLRSDGEALEAVTAQPVTGERGLLWPDLIISPVKSVENCERVVGSIRRECLDHVIVLNERHLCRILSGYFDYYQNSRPHLSLDRNSPTPRAVELPSQRQVISNGQVGGWHHRYSRAA